MAGRLAGWRERFGLYWPALLGLVLGGVLAVGLFRLPALPFWLVVGLALSILLLSFWQAERIRTYLTSMGSSAVTDRNSSDKRYWLWRGGLLAGLLLLVITGRSLWWAQSNNLPLSYAWQHLQWELGVPSLPEMVPIPAGEFVMGDEEFGPAHEVRIFNPFMLSQHEVTFEQYDYFIWSLRQQSTESQDGLAELGFPGDEGWERSDRPVINVSWQDAQAYSRWLSDETGQSCRLPSEAEWEYAARAGTTTVYPWGNEASHEFANYGKDECCEGLAEGKDQWVNTAPVGQFPANPFDLQDMHGNVWEWVQDCWHDDYKDAPTDGSVWDEANGGQCGRRVIRGGGWGLTPNLLRSAYRNGSNPGSRNFGLGFRVLCSPPFER